MRQMDSDRPALESGLDGIADQENEPGEEAETNQASACPCPCTRPCPCPCNCTHAYLYLCFIISTIVIIHQSSTLHHRLACRAVLLLLCNFHAAMLHTYSEPCRRHRIVLSCHMLPCHAMPCHAMLCCAMPCSYAPHSTSHANAWHGCRQSIDYWRVYVESASVPLRSMD